MSTEQALFICTNKQVGAQFGDVSDAEDLENYKNPRLEPAKNVRLVIVCCCGTCKHHKIISGFFLCRREGGYECDANDGRQWEHVCDLWQGENHQ